MHCLMPFKPQVDSINKTTSSKAAKLDEKKKKKKKMT